ncbi:MAG: ATP synthase F1 subunit delta [Nitrospinae bacterium]|nr:ATP synthase F1 subunit delta [Nitrospinota bacterium]
MKDTLIARRYAAACVETHTDRALLSRLTEEVAALALLWRECRDWRNVEGSPAFSAEEKGAALDAVLTAVKVSPQTRRLLELMKVNGRMGLLPALAEELAALAFAAMGKVKVDVVSAIQLSDADRASLVKRLSAFTGKEAVVEVSVDPALIGGVVTRIGSVVYDGSVKNQLDGLRAQR